MRYFKVAKFFTRTHDEKEEMNRLHLFFGYFLFDISIKASWEFVLNICKTMKQNHTILDFFVIVS